LNASHLVFDHVEFKNMDFAIYGYATSGNNVTDMIVRNCNFHDPGVSFMGNTETIGAINMVIGGGGGTLSQIRIEDNVFQNMYIPVNGPGNSGAIFLQASDVVVANNHFTQVMNRG